jgi:hypothetical protein
MEPIDQDSVLVEFFSSMKAEDLRRATPGFPQHKNKKSRMLWVISAGIAACLILGTFLLTEKSQDEKRLHDQIVFTLYMDVRQGDTYFEVTEESSMDTWEPATQFLLDIF